MNIVTSFESMVQVVPRLRNRSLQWQILLLLLVVFVPTSTILGTGIFRFVAFNEQVTWEARQREAALSASHTVGDFVQRLQEYLAVVGALEPVALTADPGFLARSLESNPALLEVLVTDEQGRPLASAHHDKAVLSSLFTIPQAGWFASARQGRNYLSGLQLSAEEKPYLIAAAPASHGGTVAARVHMGLLWDVVSGIRFGQTGHAYVVAANGRIIAHQNAAYVLANTSLQAQTGQLPFVTGAEEWSGTYTNFSGEQVQSVSVTIPNTEWFLVAELPVREAEMTGRWALGIFLVGATLFGFLIMGLTYQALRRLVLARLSALSAGVRRIGGGDLTHRVKFTQQDEIGQLAREFDQMVSKLAHRERQLGEKTAALTAEVESHRETQDALRQLNQTLEERIAERTQDLELLNHELVRSNRELQEFAYVASHDLQEPLRKICAFGDRLTDKYAALLDERGKDYIQRMQNSATRMQTLIDALLTYSRVTTKAQPFAPTDLNVVMKDVLSDLEVRLQETKGRVEVEPLATIDADATQLRLLLQNLLGNALKFHHPDRPPVVTVSGCWVPGGHYGTDSKAGRFYRLTVTDNGIGFAPEFSERIFQVFQRLHGRSEYEGTGVGLAICRKIVERHGGTIIGTGTPGWGAVFTVTLPGTKERMAKESEANHG